MMGRGAERLVISWVFSWSICLCLGEPFYPRRLGLLAGRGSGVLLTADWDKTKRVGTIDPNYQTLS